uniref:aprataxin and PNK-like factor isoform X2 n=1 Tax=Myxine glutinosa TaxID=7769 RepID=UPI00358F74A7
MALVQLRAVRGPAAPSEALCLAKPIQLGRGPPLCVTDKRVSRRHCTLEMRAGKLRLLPTHVNPCFYIPREAVHNGELPQELEPVLQGSSKDLRPGDIFGLLPDTHIYEVVHIDEGGFSKGETICDDLLSSEENGVVRMCGETEMDPVVPLRPQEELDTVTSGEPHDLPQAKGAPAKRCLPKWMLDAVNPSHSTGPTGISSSRSARAGSGRTSSKRTPQKGRMASTLQGNGTASEYQQQQWEPDEQADGEQIFTTPHWLHITEDGGNESVNEEESAEATNTLLASDPLDGKSDSPATVPARDSATPEDELDEPAVPLVQQTDNQMPINCRTPCSYGRSCYRKNPVHFTECSHPGDPDYKKEDAKPQNNQPQCPYGTACYRQNPQHKRDFQHTTQPASHVGSRCGYDSNDMFVVDDVDDSDEGEEEEKSADPEWCPAENDDEVEDAKQFVKRDSDTDDNEEAEDIDTLVDEAKEFVKRRRV